MRRKKNNQRRSAFGQTRRLTKYAIHKHVYMIYKNVTKLHISVCFGTVISICYWANYTQGKTKLYWKSENACLRV